MKAVVCEAHHSVAHVSDGVPPLAMEMQNIHPDQPAFVKGTAAPSSKAARRFCKRLRAAVM